jgi:putative transcriptional regulator
MKMTVRLKIPELRARLNRMTQAELAKTAGLSKTTVSNLESGRLRRIELDTISKLCSALNCTPNDLFDFASSTEAELAKRQRMAFADIIGSVKYDTVARSEDIDRDLAKISNEDLTT